MRSAETAARGAIIVTIVAIITADMMSERYVMNATSEPIDIAPLSMRCPPNQMTAMLEAFITNIMVGNISAIRRPALQRGVGQVLVHGVEALRLDWLADERPHDAHADDLPAQHRVDVVEPLLHEPELRHHARHDDAEDDHQQRQAHGQQPRQAQGPGASP